VVFGLESLCDGFGVVPVASHRVPPAPFPACERVKTVVGDDVETVPALHDVAHRLSVDHFDANPKRLVRCERCVDQRRLVVRRRSPPRGPIRMGLWPRLSLSTEVTAQGSALTGSHAPGSQRSRWACRPVRSLP
jgi:hypothetical protein